MHSLQTNWLQFWQFSGSLGVSKHIIQLNVEDISIFDWAIFVRIYRQILDENEIDNH